MKIDVGRDQSIEVSYESYGTTLTITINNNNSMQRVYLDKVEAKAFALAINELAAKLK